MKQPWNKQHASLQKIRKSTKKQAKIHGKTVRLAALAGSLSNTSYCLIICCSQLLRADVLTLVLMWVLDCGWTVAPGRLSALGFERRLTPTQNNFSWWDRAADTGFYRDRILVLQRVSNFCLVFRCHGYKHVWIATAAQRRLHNLLQTPSFAHCPVTYARLQVIAFYTNVF